MNPEQTEIEAGRIIGIFLKTHNAPGKIGVLNGVIAMLPVERINVNFHGVQTISQWQMQNGLTGLQWSVLAKNLHELLILENKCQSPQKH